MIRYVRWLFLALFGLGLLMLAVANRVPVTVRLLPEDLAELAGLTWRIELPLFLVFFAGIVAGVMIGFVWEWVREIKHRSAASTKAREVSRLERELAVIRDSKAGPADDVLALLERPGRR